jgi:hypothetical protein
VDDGETAVDEAHWQNAATRKTNALGEAPLPADGRQQELPQVLEHEHADIKGSRTSGAGIRVMAGARPGPDGRAIDTNVAASVKSSRG